MQILSLVHDDVQIRTMAIIVADKTRTAGRSFSCSASSTNFPTFRKRRPTFVTLSVAMINNMFISTHRNDYLIRSRKAYAGGPRHPGFCPRPRHSPHERHCFLFLFFSVRDCVSLRDTLRRIQVRNRTILAKFFLCIREKSHLIFVRQSLFRNFGTFCHFAKKLPEVDFSRTADVVIFFRRCIAGLKDALVSCISEEY